MSDLPAMKTVESNSRRVLRGFVAMSASSLGIMAVQLGYTSITSRLLPPSAFGSYATALSGVALAGMLGGSTLGLAAARRDVGSTDLDRSLIAISLFVGVPIALLTWILAVPWASLWGDPGSIPIARLLAVATPLTSMAAVYAGIVRREGRTSAVAKRTAVAPLAGMAVGVWAIAATRDAWSLAVSAVVTALVSAIALGAATPVEKRAPAWPGAHSIGDTLYASKAAGLNLLRQATLTLPAWSVGRFAGSSELGAFNRATVVFTMPLDNLQRALTYALFPELRRKGPVATSPGSFTDLIVLTSWCALLVGGLGYFAAAPTARIVLGPQWTAVESVAGVALLLGVVPMIGAPMQTFLEALGEFRATLGIWVVNIATIVAGVVATHLAPSALPALLALLASASLQALVASRAVARRGILDTQRIFSSLRVIVPVQAGICAVLEIATRACSQGDAWFSLITVGLVGGIELLILWKVRFRTPFGRVAQARGLPGFRSA